MSSIILFPIRCYSCNFVLGYKQYPFEQLISEGFTPGDAMDVLGIFRLCCRMNVLSPAVIPFGGDNEELLELEHRLRNLSVEHRRETSTSAPLLAMQNPQSVQGVPSQSGEESISLSTEYPAARTVRRIRSIKSD